MVKDSIYRSTYERREKRTNLGFNYKGQILKRTLSSQLFEVNETLTTYISNIEKIVYEWVEAVKRIKTYVNPAVDKYENKLN
jgi:hypothetical protein